MTIYDECVFFTAEPHPEDMQARLRAVELRLERYLTKEEEDGV